MSYDASRGGWFVQTVRVLSYGGSGVWPNRHITIIMARKA